MQGRWRSVRLFSRSPFQSFLPAFLVLRELFHLVPLYTSCLYASLNSHFSVQILLVFPCFYLHWFFRIFLYTYSHSYALLCQTISIVFFHCTCYWFYNCICFVHLIYNSAHYCLLFYSPKKPYLFAAYFMLHIEWRGNLQLRNVSFNCDVFYYTWGRVYQILWKS